MAPYMLTDSSINLVKNIYNNIKRHPKFQHLNVRFDSSYLISSGCVSVIVSDNNGRTINMFMFCPDDDGKIGSIAIYGSQLREHYATISRSRIIFGFPVNDIKMDSGLSDFVDIEIGEYNC